MKTNDLSNKRKRTLTVILLLFITAHFSLHAQVTVGGLENPAAGALLDLNSSSGTRGGLLLSNVPLTDLSKIPGGYVFTGIENDQDNNTELTGAIVYNMDAATGQGIYIWNGTNWTPISEDCRELAPPITLGSQSLVVLENKSITVSVNGASPQCSREQYKWYKTSGTTGIDSYETTPFAETSTGFVTLTVDTFPTFPSIYKVKVQVISPYLSGGVVESTGLEIAVGGCPAKINATEWLFFQCHNLGGEDITSDADLSNITSSNFRSYHGDWYKFGAKDPSLKNTEANDVTPGDWSAYPWQDNADDWNPANNPCPDGWRLPTYKEYRAVLNEINFPSETPPSVPHNAITRLPNPDQSSWNNGGIANFLKIGDYLYFPAAGERYYDTGALSGRGVKGECWSSSNYDNYIKWCLFFSNNQKYVGRVNRAMAMQVRCVR
jgi:uncharacterized protein (TIGR02145 family)